jgi:hypothetical protein
VLIVPSLFRVGRHGQPLNSLVDDAGVEVDVDPVPWPTNVPTLARVPEGGRGDPSCLKFHRKPVVVEAVQ